MGWEAADIPDQTRQDQTGADPVRRVAVVTGANGGLGLETTRELARKGAHVVMAARDLDKADEARDGILAQIPGASLEIVPLDLGSLRSVRSSAATIVASHPMVDILVNNAGIMAVPERRTGDGFESQFGTNHLGHFVLTARLMPALLRAPSARIVSVTSTARFIGGPLDPDNPNLEGRYREWDAYGQSKLANLHFAVELDRRLRAAGATASSLAAHPGLSHTGLQVHTAAVSDGFSYRFFEFLAATVGMSAANGALPQLRAATDPDAKGGEMYVPRWVTAGPPVRRSPMSRSLPPAALHTLWDVSESETGEVFDVAAQTAAAR